MSIFFVIFLSYFRQLPRQYLDYAKTPSVLILSSSSFISYTTTGCAKSNVQMMPWNKRQEGYSTSHKFAASLTSWGANRTLASTKILTFHQTRKSFSRLKQPVKVHNLRTTNQFHALLSYLFKTHLNIILTSTPSDTSPCPPKSCSYCSSSTRATCPSHLPDLIIPIIFTVCDDLITRSEECSPV
jgi:hypothetical protein